MCDVYEKYCSLKEQYCENYDSTQQGQIKPMGVVYVIFLIISLLSSLLLLGYSAVDAIKTYNGLKMVMKLLLAIFVTPLYAVLRLRELKH
jgi:hypothetical protein